MTKVNMPIVLSLVLSLIIVSLALGFSIQKFKLAEIKFAALKKEKIQEEILIKDFAKSQISIYSSWWQMGCEDAVGSLKDQIGETDVDSALSIMLYEATCQAKAKEIEKLLLEKAEGTDVE